MKLESLYIENFGGLSRYSLNFEDGITVVQEANGFGKTTLAEFIRAMFYGFPRKAKTLEKSLRQKYTPWNGGKFGGNLVFSLNGRRYRIERTFGATPKGDKFTLIDLDTNQKSSDFTEEIGSQLFQLDSDSFERSTYFPQLREGMSLTTNAIQAKLGDLVEDTNDINNFDRAVELLKGKRSGYIPFRGNGGSVAEANLETARLQRELEQLEGQRIVLDHRTAELDALDQQLAADKEELGGLREKIRHAAAAQSAAAARKELARLEAREQTLQEELAQLCARYPAGIPEQEQIETARQAAARLGMLRSQTVTTREDREALEALEEHRERFAAGVPTEEELQECGRWCAELRELSREADRAGLSQQEQAQYEKLLPLFEAGKLEESLLEACAETNRTLVKKRLERESCGLDGEERARLTELEAYFAPGVPKKEALEAKQRDLERAQQLRQENLRLAAAQPVTPKKMNPVPAVVLLVLAIAGIAAGIVLLARKSFVSGGIGLGVGILALLGAVFLGLRLMITRELSGGAGEQGTRARNEEQIAALEQEAARFAGSYTATMPLDAALREIGEHQKEYMKLMLRTAKAAYQEGTLDREIGELEAWLLEELGSGDYEKAILRRQLDRSLFLNLRKRHQEGTARASELRHQASECQEQAERFLSRFFETIDREQLSALTERLTEMSRSYRRAELRAGEYRERKDRHDRETERLEKQLREFLEGCVLQAAEDVSRQLLTIRDDRRTMEEVRAELETLRSEKAAFRQEHEQELSAPETRSPEDIPGLQAQERALADRILHQGERGLQLRQECRSLQEKLRRIPEQQDALEQWQQKKEEGLKKARLLDETVEFLQKAKGNLSLSYMGPIRERFGSYMEQLAALDGSRSFVSPELEVRLEQGGESRELAYFSAGQTDVVMLCMRLALVDALFREVKPIVILDDPFVNLDDERTEKALALLRELAKEKQILYLVCNSSRSLS